MSEPQPVFRRIEDANDKPDDLVKVKSKGGKGKQTRVQEVATATAG